MHIPDYGDPRKLEEFLWHQLAVAWDRYRRKRTPENRRAYLDALKRFSEFAQIVAW
jgi:hypothetical protein